MNTDIGVTVPATDNVQPMKMPCAVVVSAVVTIVPPIVNPRLEPDVAAAPAERKNPPPTHVDVDAAVPIARNVRSNWRYQGTADRLIGTVCATDAPNVLPPVVVPHLGVIVSVPDAPVDMIPYAVTRYIFPARASPAFTGVQIGTDHNAVSVVAVTAVRFADGGSTSVSMKYCLLTARQHSASG
jgi:hypothetical protein